MAAITRIDAALARIESEAARDVRHADGQEAARLRSAMGEAIGRIDALLALADAGR